MIKSLMAKAVQGDVRAAGLLTSLALRLLDMEAADGRMAALPEEDLAILESYQARLTDRGGQAGSRSDKTAGEELAPSDGTSEADG